MRPTARLIRLGSLGLLVSLGISCTESEPTPLELNGPPASVSILSGDGQPGPAGAPLAQSLTVLVPDEAGRAVPAVAVTWTATGGSLSAAVDSTNDDGQASVSWTMPASPGNYSVQASIAGLTGAQFSSLFRADRESGHLHSSGVAHPAPDTHRRRGPPARLALITTALIYSQIVFGALLRHTGERLDGHLLFAALVAIHVVLLLLRVTRCDGAELALIRPAYWLGGLLLVQLLLGTATYLGKFTALLPLRGGALVLTTTTHLIIGALMLVTSLTLALRAFRLSKPGQTRQGRKLLTEEYSV